MARQYHNLEGWLRDAVAAVDEYERDPGGDGTSAWCRFLDILYDAGCVFASEVEADEDDPDDTPDGNQGDVDGRLVEGREADAPQPRRHDARVEVFGTPASRLGRHVGDVPGRVGTASEPEQPDVRGVPLGAPGSGVMWREPQTSTPAATLLTSGEVRSRPRGAPAPARTRKGVSRGKKRTTKKRR